MERRISIPAITREMDFIARNAAIADEVLQSESESTLVKLTDSVYARANEDADTLFRELEAGISAALKSIVRLVWVNTNRGENWQSWGRLYGAHGPMRRIGSAGIWLGDNLMALRLIGWVWPRRGGLDGRRELVRVCNKRIKNVCLPHEHPARYPGSTEEDGVVWLDERLTLRSALDDVTHSVAHQAKAFFKVATPILKELICG